jgi:thiol-disulfide isomerase/thioredoxin
MWVRWVGSLSRLGIYYNPPQFFADKFRQLTSLLSIRMQKRIISNFQSRDEFFNILKLNPGLVIVKLGATWCGPCKKIAPALEGFFATSPPDVVCADIDVDKSIDFYAMLKSKKMVNGIPVILCYKKGNTTYIPDDSVTGADPNQLAAFFKRCGNHLVAVQREYPPPKK